MTSIKLFGVREEDIPFIKNWAESNQVEVDLDSDLLSAFYSRIYCVTSIELNQEF